MKLKRQSRFHHEVSTGALNDIMFFLLLFFLIVATVANPQVIKLALPQSSEAGESTPKPVYLTLNAEKQFFVGESETPLLWDALEATLQEKIKGLPDPTVVLRVEKTNDVQSLVDVLDLGMRLRVKMVLQTSAE
jgi:biopolymer transport protein ExbD